MATNGAVVGNSQLDTTLVRDTQERHIAGNGVQRTNLDLLTVTDTDLAEASVTQMVLGGTDLFLSWRSSRSRSSSRGRRSSGSRRGVASGGSFICIVGATGPGDQGKAQQHRE